MDLEALRKTWSYYVEASQHAGYRPYVPIDPGLVIELLDEIERRDERKAFVCGYLDGLGSEYAMEWEGKYADLRDALTSWACYKERQNFTSSAANGGKIAK